jgi:RNAse (barnase) inhibitor barstar
MSDDEQPVAEPVQVLAMAADTADALLRLAASLGLDAVRIDLEGCSDKAGLLERVATALGFPEWFGGNWDALYDCLADLGWREAAGWLLVLENTGDLRRHAPEALDTAVAILGDAAEAWAARGRVFRAFVAA